LGEDAGHVIDDWADAETDREDLTLNGKVKLLNCMAKAFGNHNGVGFHGIAQDDGKLVAAQSREKIRGTDGCTDQCGCFAEKAVAGGVATCIVHDFELIEIEEEEKMRPILILGLVAGGKQRLFKSSNALRLANPVRRSLWAWMANSLASCSSRFGRHAIRLRGASDR
jgi:hypothetical protein